MWIVSGVGFKVMNEHSVGEKTVTVYICIELIDVAWELKIGSCMMLVNLNATVAVSLKLDSDEERERKSSASIF